ncbi:acyl-CoA thioester hydrolase/BAAT C-terminal domain-containing protein [Enterococcus sp. HY326]|uniref:acyl-CoA thioester hydrolase/BAAT C-terminal domain-containing protein n=1 Tax=Enterococcus sp. HY326 TaxID=2971265 RepID=UPI00223FBF7D|nr:acyl-CoA thioester hydrolase/BAAT C-terminal domain-containing protein [Enterococcus sp. HY326]
MNITITEINQNQVVGYQLTPEEKISIGTVIIFGGSEGSCRLDLAKKICENGYEVFALYYFGRLALAPTLDNVEISFFSQVLEFLGPQHHAPITLLGLSRGAELCLILSAYYLEIKQLILVSPSNYFFPGQALQAAWACQGQALPHVPVPRSFIFKNYFKRKRPSIAIFEELLSQTHELERYQIPVENFSGEMLLFSGGLDQTWPASTMAQKIASRAQNAQHFHYPRAGHSFIYNFYDGPDWEADLFADHQSWQIIQKSLAQWHKKNL